MITRRNFMAAGCAALAGGALYPKLSFGAGGEASASLTLPTPAQLTWQNCEIGMIYHFDMPIAAGDFTNNNATRKVFDPKLYNPVKLDTDQWIEAAKAVGAKYALFTATHFNGFMQWQSDIYPYGLKQAAWRNGKGDIVADFVASCRKAGILPGIYFSTNRNVYQKVWGHYVNWGKGKGTPEQDAYNRIAEKQFTELMSNYGDIFHCWFDAGCLIPAEGGGDMLSIFEKYQPNGIFYSNLQRSDIRWIGTESGIAGYPCWATMPNKSGNVSHNSKEWKRYLLNGDPDGTVWSPGMADMPLRNHNWFWKPGQDGMVNSLERLMKCYESSVGRNCNLLLGEVITSEGLVPDHDIKRLKEFSKTIQQRYGKAIGATSGTGNLVELKIKSPRQINSVIIMEDIAKGERIQSYTLEGRIRGNWKTLCMGRSVGHKRIQSFEGVDVDAVRLRVTASKAEPQVKRLAVFNVV